MLGPPPNPTRPSELKASDMRRTPLSTADDRSLADAVAGTGDERAFRELYRRHTPALYQLVLRMLGGVAVDAEDVVQEAWIRAVRQLSKFRWESSLRTWLTAIGLNLARETLRKRARTRTEEIDDRLELSARPVRDAERIDLERAIARLPNGYRTVLVLHDVQGFTHEEISRQLQIAVGTSKSQLFDARRAVRSLLQSQSEASHA
ncbi:MAG: sigma-70 family RNA polymerase sigma factor [Candidatus Eisenbacteria bacterium]|uniref:Sigma-70 family RNA polymerase sigma factor n=1 Tax=Eiseniibacteriota bacterium TaxID=2212470 RepID=A0A538SPT2_UNCEI|nr:MAG: sigma-70 family RNA polymerase sigma factor [Candidatus Eisenbacteria bacterium]